MRKPVDAWPFKKSFSPASEEELRKDMMQGVCGVLQGGRKSIEAGDQIPSTRKGGIDRLIRVYGYVIAIYKWRKKTGAQGPVIINPIKEGGSQNWLSIGRMPASRGTVLTGISPERDGNLRSKNAGHRCVYRGGRVRTKKEAHPSRFTGCEPGFAPVWGQRAASAPRQSSNGRIVHEEST
jgi:hypothetical protein